MAVGYERLRITFSPVLPAQASVTLQSGTTFAGLPSGRTFHLDGTYGALVTLHPADNHGSYRGPSDFKPRFPVLSELRLIEDSDGTVEWAVGLGRAACYRVAYLTDPLRLAVDFRAG